MVCSLTVSGQGKLSVHLPPLPYALALVINLKAAAAG
jgi:hypothetical protein